MPANSAPASAGVQPLARLVMPVLFAIRITLFAGYLVFGLLLALLIGAYFVQNKPWQQPFIRLYCAGLCRILRIRIQVSGKPPNGAALVVSNHISWLDIPVLFACLQDLSFLSKAEVRQWPLIGILGVACGTIFIRRGGGQANTASSQIAKQLSNGRRVVVFPEGTTTVGNQVLPFHAKLFDSALISGTAVKPALLHYQSAPGEPSVAPFVGDDDFRTHLCRILVSPPINVTLSWLSPIDTSALSEDCANDGSQVGPSRTQLAKSAHQQVSEVLTHFQAEEHNA